MTGSAEDLYRPFRPRAGRVAPWVAAGLWVAVLIGLSVALPGAGAADAIGFAAVGALGVWLMSRFAGIVAIPTSQGLEVRNLFGADVLSWAEIVSVTFGRDSTFAHLDLAAGSTAAVLAIQSADGAYARREATRLATLVEFHTRPPRDGSAGGPAPSQS